MPISNPKEKVLSGGMSKPTVPVSSGSYWSYLAHVRRFVPEKNRRARLNPSLLTQLSGAFTPSTRLFRRRWLVLWTPREECHQPP